MTADMPIVRWSALAAVGLAAVLIIGLPGCQLGTAIVSQEESSSNETVDAGLQPDGTGWLLDASHQLFVTGDGGDSWQTIAPPVQPDVVAMSGDHMLVASLKARDTYEAVAKVGIAVSEDLGLTWIQTEVAIEGQPGGLRAAVNGSVAAILVQQTTSSNFSEADVLVSKDGQAWSLNTAPIAGEISIVSSEEIWIAGGASGSELFRSEDLGAVWELVKLPVPSDVALGVDVPRVTGGDERETLVTVNGDTSRVLEYASKDSGLSWDKIRDVAVPASTGAGVSLPATFVEGKWRIALPDPPAILFLTDGESSNPTRGLEGGVMSLAFATTELGWALSSVDDCPTKTDCQSHQFLFRTRDGGATWEEISQALPD